MISELSCILYALLGKYFLLGIFTISTFFLHAEIFKEIGPKCCVLLVLPRKQLFLLIVLPLSGSVSFKNFY